MSKQRPSNHLMSGLFDVLADVGASGTRRYWEKAESTGIVLVIATDQDPSFRRSELHGMLTAHILQANSFDHQPEAFKNH